MRTADFFRLCPYTLGGADEAEASPPKAVAVRGRKRAGAPPDDAPAAKGVNKTAADSVAQELK